MIQRIQTVWLFLAALCFFSLFFIPFGFGHPVPGANGMLMYAPFKATSNMLLLILTIAGASVSLGNIFMYKNRPTQALLCFVIIAIGAATGGYACFKFYTDIGGAGLGLGLIIPVVAMVFAFLAHRGIKADDALVKSADRLR